MPTLARRNALFFTEISGEFKLSWVDVGIDPYAPFEESQKGRYVLVGIYCRVLRKKKVTVK